MTEICRLLKDGICTHQVLGPLIVTQFDCDACISFNGRESPELKQIEAYRDRVQIRGNSPGRGYCKHLGTKLRVAPCCGQMFACKIHKGKKCAPVGLAKDPFLSCWTCPDFLDDRIIAPTIVDRSRFAGRCIAVTSLSPNLAREQRQLMCLNSWRDMGLEILAVNTAAEHAQFSDDLRECFTPITSEDVTYYFERRTLSVCALIRAGIENGIPFLLINSDIEMRGEPSHLERALSQPEALSVGVRHNHNPDEPLHEARIEPAGIDAFLMTPAMAATLPPLPYGIGKPMWDYWLPFHFQRQGHQIHWMRDNWLFHEEHEKQWTPEDLKRGYALLRHSYDLPDDTDFNDMRQSFERPEITNALVTASLGG